MSTMRHVPSDPARDPEPLRAPDDREKDVGTRAADLVDTLYAHAEQQRRRESLENLIGRAEPETA